MTRDDPLGTPAVTIRVRAGGPYKVIGPALVLDEDGIAVDHDGDIVLCRCGRSMARPRCDGTHRTDL